MIRSELPNWPNCDKNIGWLLPNGKDLECGLGLYAIQVGLRPFYESRVFQELWRYAESPDRSWEDISAFISGSVGMNLIHAQFSDYIDQKILHWSAEMTGADPSYYRKADFDAYLSNDALTNIKSKFKFKEVKSRTVKGLVLTEITERVPYYGHLKFQFHRIEGSNHSPIEQCQFLAPTNLHKVGVIIGRGGFLPRDPEDALRTNPMEQKPPMHLISPENPLSQNIGRIINGILIYGLMTPKLTIKFKEDYKLLEKYVTGNIGNLTIEEKKVLLEKYHKYQNRNPWADRFDDIDHIPKRLAKLGLLKPVMSIAKELNDNYVYDVLSYLALLYAQHIEIPDALKLDDQEVGLHMDKYRSELTNIFKQIDWEKV